ncbi:primosomal protein N' [Amnibacterium sp. CER49]|uniref:primosomal protein N' family DNA-binding protein n=1 Tax=Amnibacterium sp. CER49 TaxID=3039161 RepID=UPI00244BF212|nr:primosomal protein N' [Amnibacterium sp. CER49]MDH2444342.1 primosomal protein N' [Amnibacterium sp. CER49]
MSDAAGAAPAPGAIARVVLDSPLPRLDHLFDYRVPPALADEVRPGVRVKVPLRVAGRSADGYVVDVGDTSDAPGRLSDIEKVVSPVVVLAPEVWRLARAVADRSAGVASDVLRIAVPKRQARVEHRWLKDGAPEATPVEAEPSAASEALVTGSRLAALPTPRPVEVAGTTVGGWAAELAEAAVGIAALGRSAIVAVPDRRDLDQLALALAHGPAAHAVLRVDATQTPAERERAHLAAMTPGPHVVIGNRAAVYAPAADLGAILVWEEADPFHLEPLAPYASTRDVALLRQEQSGCGLLLLGSTRSSTVQRLVRVGWLADRPAPRYRPEVVLPPDDVPATRIPSATWRAVRTALATGPVLVQVARPGDAARVALAAGQAPPPIDAGRTAHELGRAFPGVPVLVADGEHVHDRIEAGPRLVVATRGAEPIAPGGYAAVLLLDGRRMLARESLWVEEDCLRWWAAAAALAAPKAPVHLVGVGGHVATTLATWRLTDFADRQLADRRALRFPPAVRLAAVSGPLAAVEPLVAELVAEGAQEIGRADEDGLVRVTVRFDYAAGSRVAAVAKAGLIRAGSARRPKPPAPPPPALRVRFDPHEPI